MIVIENSILIQKSNFCASQPLEASFCITPSQTMNTTFLKTLFEQNKYSMKKLRNTPTKFGFKRTQKHTGEVNKNVLKRTFNYLL